MNTGVELRVGSSLRKTRVNNEPVYHYLKVPKKKGVYEKV